jgi:hypothetical protein
VPFQRDLAIGQGGVAWWAVAKVEETLTRLMGLPYELTALAREYRDLTSLAA